MNSSPDSSHETPLLPLVVDLDGTLFIHDSAEIHLFEALFSRPRLFFRSVFLVATGRPQLAKFELSISLRPPDFNLLPLNQALFEYVSAEKQKGRKVILCTGASEKVAAAAAAELGIFDTVLSSDKSRNLTGLEKGAVLEYIFGREGFEYIGNAADDFPVYERAVSSKHVPRDFPLNASRNGSVFSIFSLLRIKHWSKNALVFLPLLAAADSLSWDAVRAAAWLFICLSFLASGTYILNDLSDFRNDLRHPEKRLRAIPSGRISLRSGFFIGVSLIGTSLAAGYLLGGLALLALLSLYLVLTSGYSLFAKTFFALDLATLAMLYTFRVVSGTIVAQLDFSIWLSGFVFLLFFGLSATKRFVDLRNLPAQKRLAGRGYSAGDSTVVATFGIASGIAAAITYLIHVAQMQGEVTSWVGYLPLIGFPVLVTWVLFLWISASRGKVTSDPVNWALKNPFSVTSFLVFVMSYVLFAALR